MNKYDKKIIFNKNDNVSNILREKREEAEISQQKLGGMSEINKFAQGDVETKFDINDLTIVRYKFEP